jgi:membrane associated rhomboid family serine protease
MYELYQGIQQYQGDNVAHFAHIGGMLFAVILLMVWKTKRNHFY